MYAWGDPRASLDTSQQRDERELRDGPLVRALVVEAQTMGPLVVLLLEKEEESQISIFRWRD